MSNCEIRFFFFFEPLGGSLPGDWNRTTPSTSENSVLWLVQIPNALKHEKYTDNRLLNSIALQQKQLISEGKEKTAFEILEEAINCKDLDWPTRINAAKAMLPYQEKRLTKTKSGKNVVKEDAVKKAFPGKFAPGLAPKIVPLK